MLHGGSFLRGSRWSQLGATYLASLVSLGACGGRTSMLDPDANGSTSAAGTGGSNVSAGGGSSGGGSSSNPSGGKAGLDPNAASAPCLNYCAGFAPLCPVRLNGQDCNSACQAEVNGFGKQCQTLGIRALKCLTPFLTPNAGDCETVLARGVQQCSDVIEKFQKCKEPEEAPPPRPDAPQDASSCPSMGDISVSTCSVTYLCANGPHLVYCELGGSTAGQYSCSCRRPDGVMTYRMLVDPSGSACQQMASYCDAP